MNAGFELPQGFKKSNFEGIDSFEAHYESDGISLSFSYGRNVNQFEGWPPSETKFEQLEVDGRRAFIGTRHSSMGGKYAISTQISIASTGRRDSLSAFASCRSEAEVEIAHKVFKSIRFQTKTP